MLLVEPVLGLALFTYLLVFVFPNVPPLLWHPPVSLLLVLVLAVWLLTVWLFIPVPELLWLQLLVSLQPQPISVTLFRVLPSLQL